LPTDIPKDQMEKIEPIVDSLLAELRRRTADLPPDADSALVYQLDAEAGP